MTAPLVLLCAGGTGGHVFPAKALGEELTARGYRVAFACDHRGVKYLDGVPKDDIHVVLEKSPQNGKAAFALSLIGAYFKTHALIGKLRPVAAVGFGGYPSAPPVFAAQHRGVPTILHESNAVLGLANKLLAPLASKIALSFPMKGKGAGRKETVVTGNPVRADIIALRDKTFPKIENEINILIFGGSLGAASFADIIPHSIIMLARDAQLKLKVAHQVRESDIGKVMQVYRDAGLDIEIKSFFNNVPERIEKAQLMICRGGASTVAETTCAGRAAVYIPYPWHKDQQQLHNAQAVADIGGGWVIEEKNLTPDSLYEILRQVAPARLEEAAAFARTLGKPDAVRALADLVVETAKN